LMVTKLAELGNKEDADQSELAEVVKHYTDIYADYGKCRQKEVSCIVLLRRNCNDEDRASLVFILPLSPTSFFDLFLFVFLPR
jgi:hypothetical protein